MKQKALGKLEPAGQDFRPFTPQDDLLAFLSARALRLTPRQTSGFVLAVTFVNAGNYGLGVNRLAFGPEVESRAVIYFVTSSILVYTP